MTLLFVLFLQPTHAAPIGDWFRNLCARHLIAEHPYQIWAKKLTTQEVILEFRRKAGQRHWGRDPDPDEYEMILHVMTSRYRGATPTDQEQIRDALTDYPDVRFDVAK